VAAAACPVGATMIADSPLLTKAAVVELKTALRRTIWLGFLAFTLLCAAIDAAFWYFWP
jgi:hypothetical protein